MDLLMSPSAGRRAVMFSLAASDSFNRGSLGNTDGIGIDGVTGGSGLTWVAQVGTWGITSNRARAATVVSNVAIATVDAGQVNGIVCARLATVSATGLVLRYVDSSNYVRAYIVNTNTLYVVQVVAGAPTTLLSKAATYVADAEMVVTLDGLRLGVEYNGTYYGSVAINAAFASSTLHGMYVNAAGSTLNLDEWHFVIPPAFAPLNQASALRLCSGEYMVTTPVVGDLTRCAEWEVRQEKTILGGYSFTSNVYHLHGARLVTVASGVKTLLSTNSGWESAGQIGATGDIEGDYGYFGSTHQSEQLVSFTGPAKRRWVRYYEPVVFDQAINTVYPRDKATIIGTTQLRHSFGKTGLTVSRSHTYTAGYQIYGWYGGLMGVSYPEMDQYQVGSAAAAAMARDDGAKNLNTTASLFKAWKAGGTFTMLMQLPSGGPDDLGDWSKSGTYKGWFKDNAAGDGKFYINYVDGAFAGRANAVASSHTVRYWVANGLI
jgi:hypothetical protein